MEEKKTPRSRVDNLSVIAEDVNEATKKNPHKHPHKIDVVFKQVDVVKEN